MSIWPPIPSRGQRKYGSFYWNILILSHLTRRTCLNTVQIYNWNQPPGVWPVLGMNSQWMQNASSLIPMHSANIVLSETKLISAHFQKSRQDWMNLAHLCYLTIEWSWLKDWVKGHPLSKISSQALGGLPMVYCAKFLYPGSRDYSWVSALPPDQKSKSHTQKFV